MELDEAVLRDWEDDEAFSVLNENDVDFAIASSLQSQYDAGLNPDVSYNIQASQKDEAFFKGLDDDLDYAFALSLQEYEEKNTKIELKKDDALSSSKKPKNLSIVDPQWELIDPNPDIHALFLEFNTEFFYGKLLGVEVKWSHRMYVCAGICCYEGRGGLCSVRLSLPLLKLRSRIDLVETLLHEMIHAYLFVTHNNKDRGDHGPEFLSHMNRINKETGARISVYHSFHDEVDVYRQHWWKCDGICKGRSPFYGLVKRTMNRAPGPSDYWFAAHQTSCGGKFIKIKEPDNYKKKAVKRKVISVSKNEESHPDIRSFMKVPKLGSGKNNSSKPLSMVKKSSNIYTIKSIISKEGNPVKSNEKSVKKIFIPFHGSGVKLGNKSENPIVSPGLSNYINESRSSGKPVGSALASQSLKAQKTSEMCVQKNKDSKSSTYQVLDSPSKRLIQSSLENYLPSEGHMPKIKESGESEINEVVCPICSKKVINREINSHLDKCLI